MVNQVNKGQQGSVYNTPQNKVEQQKLNQTQGNEANSKASTKAAADSVSLTPQAKQMKSLQEKAERSSGFDQQKVDELKQAISEGKYQVDSEKLAKNIAAFEFDLYG
ncbi:flagellar biosynthesis anti-sigma factor FlgM [Pseudoalteromonas sp. Cnat2-41]|uniref:flagellar biosynthesis anti-sigma factor FlgM n=1 Tax=unclassified Pseudoalteromonas TaxID=194690 RepID=UPI001EF9181C|nr:MULTISPECIES: flagellar biosynthesis anti-sigma factor FlgM [unclassified Pseudoalteromonas]MCF2863436.1 flagellar biosynthesis anti-sigma factor FlgM [Pseudoalteromonas sp. CNAT2-18]MCG7558389.1 flagellar biosynthesis anti-sigma factor FlgM [Pseudoalteromonas sp. CNAT2-18.1]